MRPAEAWLYAAEWGSYMHNYDPGACMYGFSEDCRPQSEQHRAACLAWIDDECIPFVLSCPNDYEPGELDKLVQLRSYLATAPVAKSKEKTT